MKDFFKKLFGKAEKAYDAVFTTVSTPADLDVKEIVKDEVNKAIEQSISECSKKYYRTITVDYNVRIK